MNQDSFDKKDIARGETDKPIWLQNQALTSMSGPIMDGIAWKKSKTYKLIQIVAVSVALISMFFGKILNSGLVMFFGVFTFVILFSVSIFYQRRVIKNLSEGEIKKDLEKIKSTHLMKAVLTEIDIKKTVLLILMFFMLFVLSAVVYGALK